MPEWLKAFTPYLLLAVNVFMAWIVWSLRQLAVNEVGRLIDAAVQKLTARAEKTDKTVDDHDDRLINIEAALKALPTTADIKRLEGAIGEVSVSMASANATLQGVKESNVATQNGVDRLYRFMLENKG